MKFLSLDYALNPVVPMTSADGRAMGVGRSKGIHVSRIVHRIMTKLHNKAYKEYGKLDREGEVRSRMGFILEMLVDQYFKDYCLRTPFEGLMLQEEIQKDGIIGTPDGVADGKVVEFKATWKSSRKFTPAGMVDAFYAWILQVGAYCHMLGLKKVLFAVFFVNGGYYYKNSAIPPGHEEEQGPCILLLEVEFEESELNELWTLMLAMKAELEQEDAANADRHA